MSWFIFALVATLGWGLADLFYKKSSDEEDRYSHLKIAVWVGLVMMVSSVVLILMSDEPFSASKWFDNAVKYSPAALGYILSMVIGYAGLRYLEVSIISPVQNASGALSAIIMLVFFTATGKIKSIKAEFSLLEIIGTAVIVIGVILLAIAENRLSDSQNADTLSKKHRLGALALIFPLLYCVFDTLGTTADGIILNDENGFGLSEIDVLIVYGFTFFVAGTVSYIFLLVKEHKFYNPFAVKEIKTKGVAALFEEAGQIFYVYAMAANPVLSAPTVASYCIVSVVLSRMVLKEKLKPMQNICVLLVITGVILLGISDGLSER